MLVLFSPFQANFADAQSSHSIFLYHKVCPCIHLKCAIGGGYSYFPSLESTWLQNCLLPETGKFFRIDPVIVTHVSIPGYSLCSVAGGSKCLLWQRCLHEVLLDDHSCGLLSRLLSLYTAYLTFTALSQISLLSLHFFLVYWDSLFSPSLFSFLCSVLGIEFFLVVVCTVLLWLPSSWNRSLQLHGYFWLPVDDVPLLLFLLPILFFLHLFSF